MIARIIICGWLLGSRLGVAAPGPVDFAKLTLTVVPDCGSTTVLGDHVFLRLRVKNNSTAPVYLATFENARSLFAVFLSGPDGEKVSTDLCLDFAEERAYLQPGQTYEYLFPLLYGARFNREGGISGMRYCLDKPGVYSLWCQHIRRPDVTSSRTQLTVTPASEKTASAVAVLAQNAELVASMGEGATLQSEKIAKSLHGIISANPGTRIALFSKYLLLRNEIEEERSPTRQRELLEEVKSQHDLQTILPREVLLYLKVESARKSMRFEEVEETLIPVLNEATTVSAYTQHFRWALRDAKTHLPPRISP
jgi:hypothetical protein